MVLVPVRTRRSLARTRRGYLFWEPCPLGANGIPILPSGSCSRLVTAQVVALDQAYTYNRFGSYNPIGMIYALRRDIVAFDPSQGITPGNVLLREDKRPRPLVLRVNKGDCLQVNLTNLPAPERSLIPDPPALPSRASAALNHDLRNDAPATQVASFHVNGLQYVDASSDGANVGARKLVLVPLERQCRSHAKGASQKHRWLAALQSKWYSSDRLPGKVSKRTTCVKNAE